MAESGVFDAKVLFEANTLVRVHIGVWTAQRMRGKVLDGEVEDNTNASDEVKKQRSKRYKTVVTLINPEHMKEVTEIANEARVYMANKGQSFVLGKGTYLVENGVLKDVMHNLEQYHEKFLDAVEDFIEYSYDKALEESRAILTPDDFRMCPTKETLPKKFVFRYGRFIVMLPKDAADSEVSSWEDMVEDWSEETSTRLILKGYELVTHARDVLLDPKRKLYETTILNVLAWCEEVRNKKSMLIRGKRPLDHVASEVEKVFKGLTDIAKLRLDDGYRVDSSKSAEVVLKKLSLILPEGDDVVL